MTGIHRVSHHHHPSAGWRARVNTSTTQAIPRTHRRRVAPQLEIDVMRRSLSEEVLFDRRVVDYGPQGYYAA